MDNGRTYILCNEEINNFSDNKLAFNNVKIGDTISINDEDYVVIEIGDYDNYGNYMSYSSLQKSIQ